MDAMDEGKALIDQQDFKGAKEQFTRILADLQANCGGHVQYLRVYRALTMVELTMTFGKISYQEKKYRLQTAGFYNDRACLLARNCLTDRGELALAKLQRAIVNGRMAQLVAKQDKYAGGTAGDWKSTVVGNVNTALDELRWSNHEGFEDNRKWANEWLQSFGC